MTGNGGWAIFLGGFPLRSLNSSLSEACDKDVLEMELLLDEKGCNQRCGSARNHGVHHTCINKVLWYNEQEWE